MSLPEPYLSVVATSRNDDHGGSLLRRMQTFLNAFLCQCRRHQLSAELILVEWNPPPDRPPLAESLSWPADFGSCRVRIIEVPPHIHDRYKHAASLPLYQMIAKNVAIRRARGQYILATNIDILFNDELVRFIADRQLRPNKMYRIDRYDVMPDVPVDGPVEEQLAYCRTHLLRINAREGTFPLTPDGSRATPGADLELAPSGAEPPAAPMPEEIEPAGVQLTDISFGIGWYPAEQHFGQVFRWADDDVEVAVPWAARPRQMLALELEPGPSAGSGPLALRIMDSSGSVLAEITLRGRSVLQLAPPVSGGEETLRFQVAGAGVAVPHDPRILNYRVLSYEWLETPASDSERVRVRKLSLRHRLSGWVRRWSRLWGQLWEVRGPVRVGLPVSSVLVRKLGLKMDGAGLSIVLNPRILSLGLWPRSKEVPRAEEPAIAETPPESPADATPPAVEVHRPAPVTLHTNACGDFTLMAREHWLALRGYPEFDAYSFNIDSVLCYAAHYAGVREEILGEPMRSYHIEHGLGSGWTPEGQAKLFERLAAKGIPYLDWSEAGMWASQMRRLNSPMIFNLENWGLADFELREAVLAKSAAGHHDRLRNVGQAPLR